MSASPAVIDGQTTQGRGSVPADDLVDQPPTHRRRKVVVLLLLLLLLAALMGLAIWYLLFRQPIPLPTIPGEVVMPTYSTAFYGVERPMAVAVTAAGDRVYVGETAGEKTARVFDAQGQAIGKMLPPISTGADHAPIYLAVNPISNEVYVSDRLTGAIYVYDASGQYLRTFEPPAGIVGWQPLGVKFDGAGNLYVADVGAAPNIVRKFDVTGSQVETFGASAGMSFPNDVAIDATGRVYVTDSNNGRLLVFGPDGTLLAQVGRGSGQGNLGLPRGVTLDSQGRVYVVDSSGHMVFVYAAYQEGASRLEFLDSFGARGVADGAFSYPNGIAVDGRGRLYVADSDNNRVQLWSY